ncbi:MAG: Zn-ribbon domain-containing OB-fold protein [Chloroflexi bacterium]|nr:Zn-ribbon domain-containing OB-fold protein [Chloroflexota bacterium]
MELARNWRLRDQRYRLEGNQCNTCGAKYFPPREVCENCRGTEFSPYQFSGHGELFSFTIMRQAPQGHEENLPYAVGMIKLDEGPMVEAQLTDCEFAELKIGQLVEMVTRKWRAYGDDGLIVYGYKFRPAVNGRGK